MSDLTISPVNLFSLVNNYGSCRRSELIKTHRKLGQIATDIYSGGWVGGGGAGGGGTRDSGRGLVGFVQWIILIWSDLFV